MGPAIRALWLVLAASCAVLLAALPCAAARADAGGLALPMAAPASPTLAPAGFRTTAGQAEALARRQPAVRKILRADPHALFNVQVYGGDRWQVAVMHGRDGAWLAVVEVARDGRVLHTYAGIAAGSFFARGHFDRVFEHPWVWLTFGVLFLAPFLDPRRLRRMLHVDLLAFCSLGVSYAYLNAGRPETAVKLFYPPLLYLVARMLLRGWGRGRVPRGRLVPVLPTAALLVGVVALFGARVALNVADRDTIDVGYASVVGADRIAHKEQLYVDAGANDGHGDTYGPVNYLAYIPFELALPWSGTWDRLPAAHAAALFFDLMTLVGLFLLGLRLRAGPEGRRLGLALAWAWAACPFTLLTVLQSSNDGLVAMLLVGMLLVLSSAPARGALLGLAIAAKFSPAALLALVARGPRVDGARRRLQTIVVAVAVVAFALAVYWPAGGLREFWNSTLGYQLGRAPDFSLWALYPGFGWTQTAVEALAAGLAVAVAVVPSRRTLTEISALAAAVLIAVQLPAGHWFYFYISWFAPLVLVAWMAPFREPAVTAVTVAPVVAAPLQEAAAAPLRLAG